MGGPQPLLLNVKDTLVERLGFRIPCTHLKIVPGEVKEIGTFSVVYLFLLNPRRTHQCMRQPPLTGIPLLYILRVRVGSTHRQDCSLLPLLARFNRQGISNYRLHQSMDRERVRIPVPRHQRVGAQGRDSFIQLKVISSHRSQDKLGPIRFYSKEFLRNSIRGKVRAHLHDIYCHRAALRCLLSLLNLLKRE